MTLDQWQGCVIGQCIADALGFVVEGHPPAVCAHYASTLKPTQVPQGRHPYAFGQYTDDSQLARELLQSVALVGKFCPDDYAGRIGAIFQEGRIVGRGKATEEAARRITGGTPWREAGAPAPSAGNGSAMRAAPVGLIFSTDGAKLAEAASTQGYITHQDPRCCAGAVAMASAVAIALRRGPIDVVAFSKEIADLTVSMNSEMTEAVRRLPEYVALDPQAAVKLIAPDQGDGWKGVSPFVIPSVIWSLYSFLRTPDDYWQTILTAIAVGGDVDTTGAMAGAISGARVGLSALPATLAARLNDRGTWRLAELNELVSLCFRTFGQTAR